MQRRYLQNGKDDVYSMKDRNKNPSEKVIFTRYTGNRRVKGIKRRKNEKSNHVWNV